MRAAHGVALAACAVALVAPAAFAHGAAGPGAGSAGVVTGYRLFQANSCGACHTLTAAGPTAHGQSGMNFNRVHVPYRVAVAVIRNGLPAGSPIFATYMVGYAKVMTPSEIRDIAAFLTKYSGGYKRCAVCKATAAST